MVLASEGRRWAAGAGRNVTGFSNDDERAAGLEGVVPFVGEDLLK